MCCSSGCFSLQGIDFRSTRNEIHVVYAHCKHRKTTQHYFLLTLFVLQFVLLQRSKGCKALGICKPITKLKQCKHSTWKEQLDLRSLLLLSEQMLHRCCAPMVSSAVAMEATTALGCRVIHQKLSIDFPWALVSDVVSTINCFALPWSLCHFH